MVCLVWVLMLSCAAKDRMLKLHSGAEIHPFLYNMKVGELRDHCTCFQGRWDCKTSGKALACSGSGEEGSSCAMRIRCSSSFDLAAVSCAPTSAPREDLRLLELPLERPERPLGTIRIAPFKYIWLMRCTSDILLPQCLNQCQYIE